MILWLPFLRKVQSFPLTTAMLVPTETLWGKPNRWWAKRLQRLHQQIKPNVRQSFDSACVCVCVRACGCLCVVGCVCACLHACLYACVSVLVPNTSCKRQYHSKNWAWHKTSVCKAVPVEMRHYKVYQIKVIVSSPAVCSLTSVCCKIIIQPQL